MICQLPDQGLLQIRGNDAKKFLQGQLSCNVEKQISMGAHCNPQGRVLFLFYLFQHDDVYYLLLPKSMVATAHSHLKKYAVFFKLDMSDVSDEWNIFGIENNKNNDIGNRQNAIYIPVNDAYSILVEKKSETNNLQATHDFIYWKSCMIRAGIPAIYPETSGKFLPHELDLHLLNAIDFDKGCYTGQEIIARMHYRGKLKNHLYLASVTRDFIPLPAADIYALQEAQYKPVGMVVDASQQVYNDQYDMLIVASETDKKINSLYLVQDTKAVLKVQNVR